MLYFFSGKSKLSSFSEWSTLLPIIQNFLQFSLVEKTIPQSVRAARIAICKLANFMMLRNEVQIQKKNDFEEFSIEHPPPYLNQTDYVYLTQLYRESARDLAPLPPLYTPKTALNFQPKEQFAAANQPPRMVITKVRAAPPTPPVPPLSFADLDHSTSLPVFWLANGFYFDALVRSILEHDL